MKPPKFDDRIEVYTRDLQEGHCNTYNEDIAAVEEWFRKECRKEWYMFSAMMLGLCAYLILIWWLA